jgi:hypothetical protein
MSIQRLTHYEMKLMDWKTSFKIAIIHPFQMVWSFFDNDAHRIVSKRGLEILNNQEYDNSKN